MLLELYDLGRSLREAGIAVGLTDNRIQPYPKKPALEVRLDANGDVIGASLLEKNQLNAIRKFVRTPGGGRQESAPGFNIDPLYRVKSGVNVDAFHKSVKELSKAIKTAGSSPDDRRKLVDDLRSQ